MNAYHVVERIHDMPNNVHGPFQLRINAEAYAIALGRARAEKGDYDEYWSIRIEWTSTDENGGAP